MSIESLNLNVLSLGEGVENSQLALQPDKVMPGEFTNTLMEKIKQLSGMNETSALPENLIINPQNGKENLQEIAGLLSQKDIPTEFSNLIGNSLPIFSNLDQGIDLNNTMESLQNAVSTLQRFNLDTDVDVLVEKIERIKASMPQNTQQIKALNQITDSLKEITELVLKSEVSLKNTIVNESDVRHVIDENEEEKENLLVTDSLYERVDENEESILTLGSISERINTVIEKMNHAFNFTTQSKMDSDLEASELESQIQQVVIGLKAIKENLSKNFSDNPVDLIDEESKVLPIENQLSALASIMNEPLKTEKIVSESKIIGQVIQEMKPEIKRETSALKPIVEEKAAGTIETSESNTLLQQENKFSKPKQDVSVIAAKHFASSESQVFNDIERGNEKSVSKFSTDLAMLNRSIIAENKVEIPPMTKHFAHPEWNKEMGERVIWMHKQEVPSAELRLNPKHLGPITIKVDVTQDQATVAFTAQHAAVKEAIEAALPKLREMLATQQLNLVDVNVSQNDSGQRQARDSNLMGGEKRHKDSNETLNNESIEQTTEIVDEIEAGRAIASNGVLSIFA